MRQTTRRRDDGGFSACGASHCFDRSRTVQPQLNAEALLYPRNLPRNLQPANSKKIGRYLNGQIRSSASCATKSFALSGLTASSYNEGATDE